IIEIPVYVFRSTKPGPVLLLQAGLHGDETNGIEIVRRLITKNEVRNPICGTIIAIPVINTFAFLYGTRDLPDGKDLNRCFPGNKNGSMTSQVAYKFMNESSSRVPFSDWHETTTGAQVGFQARSVVGGFFIKSLEKHWAKKK
ncbi:MAG: DUF1793 domain-containing protein, partial [Cytophagia bacterium]|nr:DUF1793 domain-containing protein [Cytophagia bacterium]